MRYIRITLLSDLCAGSGRSFGNTVDTDYNMDRNGFPVISGRSLKGCLKQAADFLQEVGLLSIAQIKTLFGDGLNNEGVLSVGDARLPGMDEMLSLLKELSTVNGLTVSPAVLADMFGYVRGQTKIDAETGTAEDQSLRFTRVLSHYSPIDGKPLVLTAPVTLSNPGMEDALKACCKSVRHIGMHRNRGLGMVKLELVENDEKAVPDCSVNMPDTGKNVRLRYRISLDANLVMNGVGEMLTCIPGRSVIGCMSSTYLKARRAEGTYSDSDISSDSVFKNLFLTGKIIWSAVTPVICDRKSEPAPLMLTYLRNSQVYVNPFAAPVANEKSTGPDGMWAVQTENGYLIADAASEILLHHRHKNGDDQEDRLYEHASLSSHMLYEGSVTAPAEYAGILKNLLEKAEFRFGHSRNIQYGKCRLIEAGTADEDPDNVKIVHPKKGEPVYVVLASDLLLSENGIYVSSTSDAKAVLKKAIGLADPAYCSCDTADYVQYKTIGGYQAKWGLQKMQIPVICGGSVFCFIADKEEYPAEIRIGEFQQEGFGLCKIIPGSEMKKLASVNEGTVTMEDSIRKPDRLSESQTGFYHALLTHLAKSAVSETAVAKFEKSRFDRALNISRMRLMTEEATDFENLRERIASIKTDKARKAADTFLSRLLDANLESRYAPENRYPEALLSASPALWNLMQQTLPKEKIVRFWDQNWKRYVLLVLHMLYYQRKAEEGELR